jgi:hypothetical protein
MQEWVGVKNVSDAIAEWVRQNDECEKPSSGLLVRTTRGLSAVWPS